MSHKEFMKAQIWKKKNLPKEREKASDEVATGYTFESDRWRGWRVFSGPITRAE